MIGSEMKHEIGRDQNHRAGPIMRPQASARRRAAATATRQRAQGCGRAVQRRFARAAATSPVFDWVRLDASSGQARGQQ